MADTTISWSQKTWNPTTGCDRISPGCDRCYALTMAGRLKRMGSAKYQNDGDARTSGPGFALTVHPDALDTPLHWHKPAKIFVDSMSDLFHDEVPDEFIADVYAVMASARWHTFQVLTKRSKRMRDVLGSDAFVELVESRVGNWTHAEMEAWPLPNVHQGVSIESNRYAFRADHLRATPAAVRWLSCEPLIGFCGWISLDGIGWVVAGGESGQGGERPMHPAWVRDLRDRCIEAGVPFHFKQWGAWRPYTGVERRPQAVRLDGTLRPVDSEWLSSDFLMVHGAGHGGRELDGRTWDAYPREIVR